MSPCARGHTKLATCARASWARRRTWPHSHYLMRQCIGVGGWDSELLTRVQQVQVQNRWAMSDDASLGGKPSLLSTSSVVLLLCLPRSVLHQSFITHPSSVMHQSCISHVSVMHQSCLRHASVIHPLRPSPSARHALSSLTPTNAPRRILALSLTDRATRRVKIWWEWSSLCQLLGENIGLQNRWKLLYGGYFPSAR